ncbi:coiled-coil domain-containing protein 40-like [Megalops cyprinoides]|uniref:coiled-coil domain-containing protein 40-like n=1 Tax=Megalops cyprinoides TaxID=118141 RepID=UPI0018649A02|nr:coiled-coil domain-containing protein 40-like [Megalops cyprinoides]
MAEAHRDELFPAPGGLNPANPPLEAGGNEEGMAAKMGGDREVEMPAVDDIDDELLVLDPEHPLMKGFQSSLKNHLEKQLEKVDMELRELRAMERAEGDGRVDLGVELYKVQDELNKLQTKLKGQHKSNKQAASQRLQAQDHLEGVRQNYRTAMAQTSQQRGQVSQLQTEVDQMAVRLLYMQGADADLRSDIAAVQTASRKGQAEKLRAAEQKNVQDLYVERLTQQLERLVEQGALYDVQAASQTVETQVAQEALSEAQTELDALLVEQKQLLQQWNNSLHGVRKRDEAYTTMQEALRGVRDQVRSLDTEIEGFNRSIMEEEERNERLTVLLNRAQLDCATSRKLMNRSQSQQEALLAKHSTYTRMLQETEHTLAQVKGDCSARQAEVAALRSQMDREMAVRRELEEKIMSKMQEQLTHDQAAKYSRRQIEKIAAQKKERELQLALLEDEMAQVMLECTEVRLRLGSLERALAEVEQETSRQQELLAHSEAEISRQAVLLERKQAAIASLNKKIADMSTKASTAHEDLGGLEIRVHKLTKELEEVESEVQGQQQAWLRQQEELVRLNQEKQTQSSALLALQAKLTTLQQKKVRTEGEIQQEQREQAEVDRHMNSLMLDIVKLNAVLNKNSQQREALEQSNALMESDFLSRLKDAERESITMQMNFDKIQEEKDILLNSLVEAERQVLLWEKKTQLVRETQMAVREEIGQGDIHFLKAEIHRMEVRYEQLMKQQGRLLREMEAVVARREAIELHSEAQARSSSKRHAQSDPHSALQNLRRRVQDTQKKSKECDCVIDELLDTQRSLRSSLNEKKQQLDELRSSNDAMTSELRSQQDTKEKNRARLIALQARAKQLQAVRDGRYRSLSSSIGSAPETAAQRLEERLQNVNAIVQHIYQESPEHQGALRRLTLAFAARREYI